MGRWRGVRGHCILRNSMKIRALGSVLLALTWLPAVHAQTNVLDLVGTWEAETPDGPQLVVINADSTASFGEETAEWRINADSIFILFGDEWVGYNFAIAGKQLTLSGGDLEEPVTLERVGARDVSKSVPKAQPPTG